MTRTCPYCAARISDGDDYIDYAEESWCSTDCLVGYYEQYKEVYDRMGLGPSSIEAAVHREIVFKGTEP